MNSEIDHSKRQLRNNISDKFLAFAVGCYDLAKLLNKTSHDRNISLLLVRSTTSSGANYEEACSAESKKDFIHKLQVVLKELREARFWLRFIMSIKSELNEKGGIQLDMNEELIRIIAKSVVTAKSSQ